MSEKAKEFKNDATEMNQVFVEFKELMDRKEAEEVKHGEALAETKAYIEKLEARLDDLDVKMQRPEAGGEVESKAKDEIEAKREEAFWKYIKKGEKCLSNEEQVLLDTKTAISSNDTTGGYFVTPDMDMNIIKDIVEFSPIRSIASVVTTSTNEYQIPKRSSEITGGYWVQEIGTRQDVGETEYQMLKIPVHELGGYTDISQHLLDDSKINLEQEIMAEILEQWGVKEGASFVTGTAVTQPEGILTNSDVAEVVSGDASAITADGLIDLYFALKTGYNTKDARFILERASIKAIRKLKDGNGNYLWTPAVGDDLTAASPALILNTKYVEVPDMPSIASNAYPVAFGNFKKGYRIIDREGASIERDEYVRKVARVVRFYGFKRVGGQVIQADAIKKMKISS